MADTSKKYAQEALGRFNPEFIQLATVMDNRDPTDSGKLKVWVIGSQSNRDDKDSWIEAAYCSPFAGRTPGIPGAQSYQQFPKGYGFWAVPPDVGCTVVICFIQARPFQALWFGCVYDDRMNTMVPGMATESLPDSGYDMPVPVTDYDRNTLHTNRQEKYPNVPIIEGLKKQNLLYDEEKGIANRSSTRQTPSTVYGMTSPRGNSFILDDGFTDAELTAPTWADDPDGYQDTQFNNPVNDTRIGSRKNEGVVLRTRSGAQLLLSESTGDVLIINRDGTARIEFTGDGDISIHCDKNINMRAGQDINMIAGRNFSVESGKDMNWRIGGNTKLQLMSKLDVSVGDQVVINSGADLRLVTAASLRMQSGSSTDITAGSNAAITASSNVDIMGSTVNIAGGGNTFTVKSGSTASSAEIGAPDFKTPSVGLNQHIHIHESWTNAENHSNAMKPPTGGGRDSSVGEAKPAEPANDVAPVLAEASEVEAVQYITSTPELGQVLSEDLMDDQVYTGYAQTYEGIHMLMPVTGTIREFGYWGKGVPTASGSTANRNGWIIQTKGDVVAPDAGLVTLMQNGGIVITHRSGYRSIFYDVVPAQGLMNKDMVNKGQTIGKANGVITFEVRTQASSLYGFSGTVDPGLFYTTVTGQGADAANKNLTAGIPSNENAPAMRTSPSVDSDSLVVKTQVRTIGSGYSQRGSRHTPRRRKTSVQRGSASSASSGYTPEDLSKIDKTAIGWKVQASDSVLIADIKEFEGSIAYQTRVGHFRNGRFYTFPDPVRGLDIAYGHLVTDAERRSGVFNNGITPEEADVILAKDLQLAVNQAKGLYAQYNMNTPYMVQIVLVEMAYQMGIGKVRGFKQMLKYMAAGQYKLAAREMRDSLWYRQTRNRTEILARRIEACE